MYKYYDIDANSSGFVRGVYDFEIKLFAKGLFGELATTDPLMYAMKDREFLETKISDRSEHLKKSLQHLSKARKKQVVFFLDNADQRDLKDQKGAFLIAQEIAEEWGAAVYVPIRPETFHQSRISGTLSAYHSKAFTISPPRVDLVLEKRLQYSLRFTQGDAPLHIGAGLGYRDRLSDLDTVIRAFLDSLKDNHELVELLDNISNGNIRLVLDLVKQFFGSGHVDTQKICDAYRTNSSYIIPLHEFLRAVMFGNDVYYDPRRSPIANLFDIAWEDPKEHFLLPMLIGTVHHSKAANAEGFVETRTVYQGLQGFGFAPEQIDNAILRATRKKLLESPARRIPEPGQDMPSTLRATPVGLYHTNRLGRNSPPAILNLLSHNDFGYWGVEEMASLRENMGYHTTTFSGPKEAVMIFSPEQALLKAQADLQGLITFAGQAVTDGLRIDQVERELMRRLLALGLNLLRLFIAEQGDGDLGEEIPAEDGHGLRRLPDPHDCRYVSIFGELDISRAVYGSREGQQIERAPLDERLGLPAGDFSYVLADWAQRFCLKGSFAEAAESLETLLGLRLGSRTLEHMNQELAGFVVPFRDAVEPLSAAEEGPILVVTADGKGVPMRRPAPEGPRRHHRRTKGEKANKKQMACVGAVYSIEPFVRTADDILDEVLRDRRGDDRPEPVHKHVWAEMSRDLDGEPLSAKDAVFGALFDDLNLRDAGVGRPVVCLMDGERALWEAQRVYFPEAVGILDLYHVLERLWTAAHCFHGEGSDEAERFVEDRLRGLLEGRVGYVIGGLRQRLTKHALTGPRRKTLESVITYLENNRDQMHYDEYIASGYPIGSGVAEGACRHLVKDRMEQSGMRWTVSGAQAMLHVRAVYLNGQWDEFIEDRVVREQTRLYGEAAA